MGGTHLDTPEGVPFSCTFAPMVSSLRRGLRKSILVGLRARGSWTWAWPLPFCGRASIEEDSAMIKRELRVWACWRRGGIRERVLF